nr:MULTISPECIES: hypothetical protein [Streptomyces]
MFEHGLNRAGYIEAPRDPDLAFEFLRVEWRRIQHYGIDLDARRYNGAALDPYRGLLSGKATRWRQIDLDWLRDQRAAGRTCRELAAETGFSPGMISYLGRQHDLPGCRTRAEPPVSS